MLTLRDHNVEDYASLRDMDATDVAILDETDRACLDQLGQYLVATDAWQRFAIWLLHKHFEPAAGEVFVENITTAPRGTVTTLVQGYWAQGLNATSMRFDPAVSSGVGVIGMEFAGPTDFGPASPVGPDDEPVLAGIAERLRTHAKFERLGVRLIRNPLGLGENEVLVETCDITHRTLHCSIGERDGARAAKNIETTWRWKPSPSETGPKVHMWCQFVCSPDTADAGHTMTYHQNYPDNRSTGARVGNRAV